jgi:hypothetical protein
LCSDLTLIRHDALGLPLLNDDLLNFDILENACAVCPRALGVGLRNVYWIALTIFC